MFLGLTTPEASQLPCVESPRINTPQKPFSLLLALEEDARLLMSLREGSPAQCNSSSGREKFGVSSVFLQPDPDSDLSSDDDEVFSSLTESHYGVTRALPQRSLTNKTIVLDMDLTLICTIGDGSDLSQRMRMNHRGAYETLIRKGVLVPTTLTQFGGSGRAVHNDVIKRPGVDSFLQFCRQVFKHVILWSAGQPSYVYDVVKIVIDPDNRNIFDHVYTSQDVVHQTVGPDTIDAMMSGNANTAKTSGSAAYAATLRASGYVSFSTKPISFLATDFPDATLESTVVVDDLPCNFIPNPSNGILIPPFSPQLAQLLANASGPKSGAMDTVCGDYCLFRLLHYFADDEFLHAEDVRKYDLAFFRDPRGGTACRR